MVYRNSEINLSAVLTASLLISFGPLVNAAVNGEQQWISNATPAASAGEVIDQRMSANGQYIVFTRTSLASNVSGIGYVWNRVNNSTTVVAIGAQVSDFQQADVDDDGKVVFVTGDALDAADNNTVSDIYHTVPGSGVYTLLSRLPGGGDVGNGASQNPRISTDGRYVVFDTTATNFNGFNDINGSASDVYRVNVADGQVDLVSRAAALLTPPPVPLSTVDGLTGNGASLVPDISADGRFVAYQSKATDLNSETDANGAEFDVVVRDMDGLISSAFTAYYNDPVTSASNTQSLSESVSAGISETGDTVVFKTQEPLDVANDGNDEWDVYTSINALVTLKTKDLDNVALGGSYGERLEIPSADGPTVWATVNVQTSDDENLVSDIYFSQADAVVPSEDVLIEIASADDSTKTSAAASTPALLQAVSADGRYVSYITSNDSQAALQNDTNGAADVYVFDRGSSYCDSFLEINQFTIDSGKWYQLALPCEPPLGSLMSAIFGDDLPGLPFDPTPGVDNSGVQWAAYTYNAMLNQYEAITLDTVLNIGAGFWIRQDTGSPVTLDMPVNSWRSASTTKFNAACIDGFHGCASVVLSGAAFTEPDQAERWNLVGNPFGGSLSRDINNVRVVMTSDSGTVACQASTDSGDSAAGCDLNEALTADVLAPIFFHWNPDTLTYDVLGRDDTTSFGQTDSQLQPWQGFWVAELNEASNQQIRLLVPEDELISPAPPMPVQ